MATTKAFELSQLSVNLVVDASGEITAINIDTDTVSEGSTNQYYTTTRANSAIDTRVTKTFVDNLGVDYTSLSNKPTIPSLTGYATESYVDTAVSNLIDSAPGTLDTLNELAAAINDDASFASTVTTALGTKLATADFTSTANTWIGTKTTDNLSVGTTNLYYTSSLFDTDFGNKTTDNLSEGTTNKYYTTAAAEQLINDATALAIALG